jgi:hypothetical protein
MPPNHTENGVMITVQTILPYIDLAWIPAALIMAERGKRLFTAAFTAACALLLRLQVELLRGIGFSNGFFGFMRNDIMVRGMIVYSVFILLFLILAHFSKGTDKSIHIAASITIMITAFCVSTLIMVL